MSDVEVRRPWLLVVGLGITQITAWGSIYYAISLLIEPLAAAVHSSNSVVVGAFSAALLTTGLVSAPAGALIDRYGGKWVMSIGSLAGATLLALLPLVSSVTQLYAVWIGLGFVMAATLYDPAFAVLTQVFREKQRRAITALTLFGGFASTVFWPLTQALVARWGWHDAVWTLAAANLLICAPLHLLLVPRRVALPAEPQVKSDTRAGTGLREVLSDRTFYGLAAAFTANALVFSAMSVHLLGLLNHKGMTLGEAAWIGALVGPMQVLGRILEHGFLSHLPASRVGILAIWMLPASLALLLAPSTATAWLALFALLYGMSNGVMTIVRGALPRELYGAASYGAVNGALATPVLIAKAAGPIAASLVLTTGGDGMTLALLALVAALGAAMFSWTLRRGQDKTVAETVA